MTRRGPAVFAAHEDALRATRVGGALAVLACGLGVVLSVAVSRWSADDKVPLLALLAMVGLAGAVAVRTPARMPASAVVATLLAGTGFVSVGMVIVGSPAVDGADNEMLFLLPVLYSAYFCRGWLTALVTGTASAGYGAVLLSVPSSMPAASWLTTSAALSVVALLVSITRARDIQRLAAAADEAGHDPLTGLLNRRGLAARAATRLSSGEPVSLLLVDIDHFKAVNDEHGHAVGDEVLVAVAHVLRRGSRTGDLVGRVGGEEFAVVLPACEAAEAVRRARTLCHRVEHDSRSWVTRVTLSVGTATTGPVGGRETDLAELLAAADEALYRAKAAGRNTVRTAGTAPGASAAQPRLPVQDRYALPLVRASGPESDGPASAGG